MVNTPMDAAGTRRPADLDDAPAGAALALLSAGLAGCGGGGAPAPVPPPPPPGPSDAEAARLLGQAGFAASLEGIAALKSKGLSAWLDEQFLAPRSQGHFDWMLARGYGTVDYRNNFGGVDASLWRKLIGAPDQLRQRVVLALSEIFVVSMNGLPVPWRGMAVAAYLDMLEERAFGSYRELLEGVTLSNAMGVYLNMRGNQKEDANSGRLPDENYAREVMQLFSIGLVELNLDGTAKTSGGLAVETYAQRSVTELARVFTGWEFDAASASDPGFMRKPMVHLASRFSVGAKKVLNVDIPASADGPTALKMALDTLANHANVGPFMGRQLIQRLVCSQPSAAYVQRVASAFNDNGRGQRGDLKAVIRAVLLDSEARSPGTGLASGKLREPVQRFVQWARHAGLKSPNEQWNIGDLSNPATRLGQSPLRSPSVFNFFRPGYVPPNSELGSHAVTAPEFQLCNESTVAGYLNFMQTVIAKGVGELRPDYAADLALAGDAGALVAQHALLLTGATLGADSQASIAAAVASMAADTEAARLLRVQASLMLVLASPDYLIQK